MIKKLFFLFTLLPGFIVAQYSIKGNFSPAEDYKWIILYKVTPTTSVYIDNSEVDGKGNFTYCSDNIKKIQPLQKVFIE